MAKLLITLTLICIALTGCKANFGADAKSSANVDTNAETSANAEAEADADADVDATADTDVEAEATAAADADAKPEADVEADTSADAHADTEADVNADADAQHRVKGQKSGWGEYVPYWNVARAFELGLYAGYQPGLVSTDNVESVHVFQTALDAKFLWSYLYGTGYIGPSLRLGQHTTFATNPVTDEGVSNTSFLFQPGLYHSIYIGDEWCFNQNLGMPLLNAHEPGIQADIGFTWVATSVFQMEFGGSASYFQTNLDVGGREASAFTIGPYLNFTFEVWGEYKYHRGYDPQYWKELKGAGESE